MVDGTEITLGESDSVCKDYMAGRQTCHQFDKTIECKTEVGERIHGDLMGPMTTVSLGRKCMPLGSAMDILGGGTWYSLP